MNKKTALFCALLISLSAFSSCSKTNDSKKSDSAKESEKSSSGSKSESKSDSKIEIYLDEEGTPYYLDADGNKMILYAYPAEESEEEYDPSEYYVYDSYDVDGLKFDIPEGWFADTSYGAPMILREDEEGNINYDETIAILPVELVFSNGDGVSKETIKEYFDQLVESGYYKEYEITDSGDSKLGKNDAKYYDVVSTYESFADEDGSEEEAMSFRTRYIVNSGDSAYCVIITSMDTDESFELVSKAYESIVETIVLPDPETQTDNETAVE